MSKPKKTIKAAVPPPKKPDPIDPALIPAWQILLKQAGKIESQLEERLDYILKTIHTTFGKTLDHWYFDGAEEGQLGDLARHFESESIYGLITSPPLSESDAAILLKSGAEWGFDDSIPTRWMFESFEEELTNGKALYQQKKEEEAAKKKLKKEEKEEKRRQALEKLSPADRKLLGLK